MAPKRKREYRNDLNKMNTTMIGRSELRGVMKSKVVEVKISARPYYRDIASVAIPGGQSAGEEATFFISDSLFLPISYYCSFCPSHVTDD